MKFTNVADGGMQHGVVLKNCAEHVLSIAVTAAVQSVSARVSELLSWNRRHCRSDLRLVRLKENTY